MKTRRRGDAETRRRGDTETRRGRLWPFLRVPASCICFSASLLAGCSPPIVTVPPHAVYVAPGAAQVGPRDGNAPLAVVQVGPADSNGPLAVVEGRVEAHVAAVAGDLAAVKGAVTGIDGDLLDLRIKVIRATTQIADVRASQTAGRDADQRSVVANLSGSGWPLVVVLVAACFLLLYWREARARAVLIGNATAVAGAIAEIPTGPSRDDLLTAIREDLPRPDAWDRLLRDSGKRVSRTRPSPPGPQSPVPGPSVEASG